MGKWKKEIAIGGLGGLLVLALWIGFDLSVLILPVTALILLGVILSKGAGLQGGISLQNMNEAGEGTIPSITFADIGGQEVAKREFLEALEFMRDSEKSAQLGIRPLKGILLSGPPGTGKTLLAKAAAGYTNSSFVAASGSQFVQMYAGVGASRVRQIFKQARSQAERENKRSAIIFIDEIDVLGAKRGQNQSHMEYDQTLNELLTQIDGVKSDHSVRVLVVGATNRSDLLDPALLRPGRFDRIVQVDLPDKQGRLHILSIHAKNKPLAEDVDLAEIAAETYGFSGAHLENLLNEAAINALRNKHSCIEKSDLRDAIEKVMLGEKANRKPQPKELERVAYHEVGHALLSEHTRPNSVASITITSRNNALGYIRQTPEADQYLYTKDQLIAAIQVCVAGAVSEEIILGQRSTGAVGDIEKATDLARKMVFAGLSNLGIVSKELPANLLHETIVQIIQDQEHIVKEFLSERTDLVREIASHLLKEESMSGDEFRQRLELAKR